MVVWFFWEGFFLLLQIVHLLLNKKFSWVQGAHFLGEQLWLFSALGQSEEQEEYMRWCRSPSTCFVEHMVLLVCRTRVCVCKNWATKCSQSLCICCCLWVLAVVRDGIIGCRKYNSLSHTERKHFLCLTHLKSFISSCSCYVIWVHAATETIESTLTKVPSVGKTWGDVDMVFKLQICQNALPITSNLLTNKKAFIIISVVWAPNKPILQFVTA